jgi:alkylation response protein AidB-like acyl-CoA dehydrogenase
MDLAFTPEDRTFQQEVRDWIAENYTPDLRAKSAASKNGYLDKEGQVAWQKKLYEKGWVAPNWPVEFGGPGLSASERYILNMELSSAGTPRSARWVYPWSPR